MATGNNVVAKRNQTMWRGLLAVAVFGLMSGGSRAQTTELDTNTDELVLLGSPLTISQSTTSSGQNSPAQTLTTGNSYSTSYGFDLGNGFKTEIEGLSSGATATRFAGLAASGNLTG